MPWLWTAPDEHLPNQTVGESPRAGEIPTYCPNCGRSLELGLDDCPGCGRKISPVAETVARPKTGVPWGGSAIVAGIVLVIISLFAAAAVASLLGSFYSEQEDAVATWIAVHLMALAIVTVVWFLGLRHSTNPLAVLRLHKVQLPRVQSVILTGAVLATSLLATSLYAGIVDWLGVGILSPPDIDSDIIFDGPAVILTFQALAFITPLSEEIFFRGFIFGGMLPRIGPWRAIIASALVFGAFHLSFGVVIPIFITGILFAWLYWRTGSLWAAVGAHAGQNSLALLVQALVG